MKNGDDLKDFSFWKNRRKSDDHYKMLAELAEDFIFIIGNDMNVQYLNNFAAKYFKNIEGEITGKPLSELFPPSISERFNNNVKRVLESGDSLFFDDVVKFPEESMWLGTRLIPMKDENGKVMAVMGISRDVTERKKTLEALSRREYQLEILLRNSVHINAVLEAQVIMRNVVASAMELVGGEGGMGGLIVDGKMEFREYNKKGRVLPVNYVFGENEGIPGWVLKTKRSYFTNDAENDPHINKEIKETLGIYNLANVTIISGKGELLGCFEIHNKESHKPFEAQDMYMLQSLAASGATALENARLLKKQKESEIKLREERDKAQRYLDIAGTIFVVINKDQTISLINKRGCEILGYEEKDIIGKNWFDAAIPESIRDEMKYIFEKLIRGEIEPFEYIENDILTKSGNERTIAWHNILLKDESGSAIGALSSGEDITERLHAEKESQESERFLSNIFTSIQDGISVLDKDMKILRVNPVMEKWYAHAMPLIGRKCFEAYHCRSERCEVCPTKITLDTGKSAYEVVPKVGPGGKIVGWFDLYSFPLVDNITGKLTGVIEYVRDISQRKIAEKKLEDLNKELNKSNKRLKEIALRDAQTELYNHKYLMEIIEPEFYRAKRYSHPLSLLMIDIDNFKSINETYGHELGNVILTQFAKKLKNMVRQYDVVIRFADKEFIVLSPSINREGALTLSERILNAINSEDFGNTKSGIRLKVSIAVVSYPDDKVAKGIDLINFADKILGKIKKEDGHRVASSLSVKIKKKKNKK